MTRIDQIKEEIVKRIKNNLKIKEIIFFGSFASGIPNKDSDLDMVVVLDERGFSKNYEERLGKRQRVTELISDLRYQIPIDVLVFTEDEWKKAIALNSSFIREINRVGVHIH